MAQRAWICESSTRLSIRGIKLQNCTEVLGSESSECDDDTVLLPHFAVMHGLPSSSKIREELGLDSKPPDADLFRNYNSWKSVNLMTTPHKPTSFPPPLESIARVTSSHLSEHSPRVSLHSHKSHGRLVLREVGFMPQEVFRASRKDGRLRLELVHECGSKNSTHFNSCTEESTHTTMGSRQLHEQGMKLRDRNGGLLIDNFVQKAEADQIYRSDEQNSARESTRTSVIPLQKLVAEVYQSMHELETSTDAVPPAAVELKPRSQEDHLTQQDLSEDAIENPQTSTDILPFSVVPHEDHIIRPNLCEDCIANPEEVDAKSSDLVLNFKEQQVIPHKISQCKQRSNCHISLHKRMWGSSILVNMI